MVRVVVAGHVNWDVTLRVNSLPDPDGEARITSQHRSCGGSAANVASALSGFGLDTSLIGSVGEDEPGYLARQILASDGVDVDAVSTVRGAETTVKYLLVDEQGAVMVLANDGANEAIEPASVDTELVASATHLHLSSQRPETARRLADRAATHDVPVSFDPGRRLEARNFESLLESVDVLFLNEREARAIFDERREDPAGFVSGTDRTLVLKRGGDGATVFVDNEEYTHPGFGVDPVDTTGAGDAFAAGFIWTRLGDALADRSWETEYERALAVANACGAIASGRQGARSAPERSTIESFLRDATTDVDR